MSVADVLVRLFSFLILVLGALKLEALIFPQTAEIAQFLKFHNPVIVFLPNRVVLSCAAVCEIAIGLYGMRSRNPLVTRSFLLLWFGCAMIAYEIELIIIHYHGPCGCMLGINRILPIPVGRQNTIAQIIAFATMIASSLVILYAKRIGGKSSPPPTVGRKEAAL